MQTPQIKHMIIAMYVLSNAKKIYICVINYLHFFSSLDTPIYHSFELVAYNGRMYVPLN